MRVPLLALISLYCSGAATAQTIELSFGSVRLDPTQQAEPAALLPGPALRLVQFDSSPTQRQRQALTVAGLRVLQYYPSNSYLVWGDAAAAQRAAGIPSLRWQGLMRAPWKRSAELNGRSGRIDYVQALLYDDGQLPAHAQQIEALGARLVQRAKAQPDGALQQWLLSLDSSSLDALQQLPNLLWLEYASPRPGLDDEASAQVVAGNYQQGSPIGPGYLPFLASLGLDGSGVRFAVTDTGIDYAHPELATRIVAGADFPGCESAAGRAGDDSVMGGHGTHVAGILAGAGVIAAAVDAGGYHYGIGVAPGVELVALNPICGNVGSVWPPANGWQDLSQRALQLGAIGSNNSWNSGEANGLGYLASARSHDFIVRDGDFDSAVAEPFVLIFSAGNAGPQPNTITAPKEAKNLIVVGSTLGTRPVPQIDSVAGSSSRGPALDGRLLPTVVAPGSSIASTRRLGGASYCAQSISASGPGADYALCSGTSMAAPHVAGLAALLTQLWRESHAGATPSPAMLKALLINGAVDVAGAPGIPNASEGWGRVNLAGSLGRGATQQSLDQSLVLDEDGETHSWTYRIVDPDQPVRVSLVWTDAPGAPGASPALVNDLDLQVQVADRSYRGNVFSTGLSASGGVPDRLNNAENVYLPARLANTLTVQVRAQALPGDGVPGVGDETDQDFALVCSNCSSEPDFTLALAEPLVSACAGDLVERALTLDPLLDFDQPIVLSGSGWPEPGTLQFTLNPINVLPAQTRLQLDTAEVPAGNYTVRAQASSAALTHTVDLALFLARQGPAAAVLQQPEDDASVAPSPNLRWQAAPGAFDYRVQVATDADFSSLVVDSTTRALQFTPASPLAVATRHYWRVLARNACQVPELFSDGLEDLPAGSGQVSATRAFVTQ